MRLIVTIGRFRGSRPATLIKSAGPTASCAQRGDFDALVHWNILEHPVLSLPIVPCPTEKLETFHELPRGIDRLPLAVDEGSRAKLRTSASNRAGWRRARLLLRLRSPGCRVRDLGGHPAGLNRAGVENPSRTPSGQRQQHYA